MGFVVSADSHVVEPSDLWADRLPKALRERGPHRRTREDGIAELVVESDGELVSVITTIRGIARGRRFQGRRPGRPLRPAKRLEDVDTDGVWAEVLYPTTGLFAWSMTDPELSIASARVYNDWMAETFIGVSPRFVCPAMIPAVDIDSAVAGDRRRRSPPGSGARCSRWSRRPRCPYFLTDYDPVWAAAQANHMPISFHVITGMSAERRSRTTTPSGCLLRCSRAGTSR